MKKKDSDVNQQLKNHTRNNFKQIQWIAMSICICVLFFTNCDTEAEVPSFIRIENSTVIHPVTRSTDFHNILQNYVFYKTELLGAFSPNGLVPILNEGPTEIIVFPGIEQNGISEEPVIYSLLKSDTIKADLVRGEEYLFAGEFEYLDNVKFEMLEDFELTTTFSVDVDENTNSDIQVKNDIGFNNSRGALLEVDEDNVRNYVGSTIRLDAQNLNPSLDLYIEITYRNNVTGAIGFIGKKDGEVNPYVFTKSFVNPRAEWSKIYIEIGSDVADGDYTEIQIFVGTQFPSSDFTEEKGYFIFDDLKLVHL